jgi:thiosulfate reductase cytochrome b subunit
MRQWVGVGVVLALAIVGLGTIVVAVAQWFVGLDAVAEFIARYPGEYELPASAPVGLPAWLGWQHFFNIFLMTLLIRAGNQVRRQKKPPAYWTSKRGAAKKISINLWFHQSLDLLWLVNGAVFVVLLFATGQWMRIVPTSWDVFPHAISTALQYLSLDWPTENGWTAYNGLQQLAYVVTVCVAAPVSAVTGFRMSYLWRDSWTGASRIFPVEVARKIHYPTMVYFVAFIVMHVTLVFATGALRNLYHMFGARDAAGWAGFWIFVGAAVVTAAGWVAARPMVLVPIARLFGTVSSR